jgi:hypothetical protein
MISGVVFQGGKFKEGLREREQLEAESHAEEASKPLTHATFLT